MFEPSRLLKSGTPLVRRLCDLVIVRHLPGARRLVFIYQGTFTMQRWVLTGLALFVAVCVLASRPVAAQTRVEKNIVYGMVAGTALLLDVHHPANPNGLGIVWVNGSGWSSEPEYAAVPLKDGGLTPAWMPALTDAGYTLFSINHRASPLFHYPAPVEDVQRAIRFVRHNARAYGVDPSRLGGFGASSGAHLIAFDAMRDDSPVKDDPDEVNRESSRLQAVVLRAAPTDLTKMFPTDSADLIAAFLDLPLVRASTRASAPRYRRAVEASPISYISRDDPPTLLIHGDADATVPFAQSVAFEAALRQAGVATKLIRVLGGAHVGPRFGLPESAAMPDVLGEMVKWFDVYLKPARGK